jgi:hypothetical protein
MSTRATHVPPPLQRRAPFALAALRVGSTRDKLTTSNLIPGLIPADVLAFVFEVFFFEVAVVLFAIEDSPFESESKNVDKRWLVGRYPLVKSREPAFKASRH